MKKILFLIFSLLLFVGCSNNDNTLNIYTWTYFIPDQIIEDFEKETGIKVNLSYYDTNDTMLAKLLSGTSEYDIVSPSTDFVQIMINANLLEKLDKNKLSNVFNNLDENLNLYEDAKAYDEGLNYTIPYMMFATGISVNKKYVKDYPRDLSIFEMDSLKGRMSMLDDSSEVIRMTLQYLGYNSNTENEKEIEEAKNQILKWKKNLAKFDNNAYSKNVATGELYVAHGYPDVFYQIEPEDEENFDYFLPKGALIYIDSMAITKNGKNKENAYKFLEYLFRPENYVKFLNEYRTISVLKDLDDKRETKPILNSKEVVEKGTLPYQLSENAKILQDKIWQEIKLEK